MSSASFGSLPTMANVIYINDYNNTVYIEKLDPIIFIGHYQGLTIEGDICDVFQVSSDEVAAKFMDIQKKTNGHIGIKNYAKEGRNIYVTYKNEKDLAQDEILNDDDLKGHELRQLAESAILIILENLEKQISTSRD